MSANSDTKKFLDYCESLGLYVEKSVHGGYRVMKGDTVICYGRAGGNQPYNWLQAARRRVRKAADA